MTIGMMLLGVTKDEFGTTNDESMGLLSMGLCSLFSFLWWIIAGLPR
jgi:hypothetical protein